MSEDAWVTEFDAAMAKYMAKVTANSKLRAAGSTPIAPIAAGPVDPYAYAYRVRFRARMTSSVSHALITGVVSDGPDHLMAFPGRIAARGTPWLVHDSGVAADRPWRGYP